MMLPIKKVRCRLLEEIARERGSEELFYICLKTHQKHGLGGPFADRLMVFHTLTQVQIPVG